MEEGVGGGRRRDEMGRGGGEKVGSRGWEKRERERERERERC